MLAIVEGVKGYRITKAAKGTTRRTASIPGTGIFRSMVHRYFVYMDEKGVIKYKGSNIITEFIEQLMSQNTVRLSISGAISCGEPQTQEELNDCFIEFPTSLLVKGEYFVLLADGESMTDAGIDDGDYVIVRKTNTGDYGKSSLHSITTTKFVTIINNINTRYFITIRINIVMFRTRIDF